MFFVCSNDEGAVTWQAARKSNGLISTWNPVTGCTKLTRGCDFCYAERFSERFRGVAGHPFERGLRPDPQAREATATA